VKPPESPAPSPTDLGSEQARSLASEIKRRWESGDQPDARAVLDRHPELRDQPSLIVDLAFEEFCLRKEAGEVLDVAEFCQGFPTCRSALGRLLEAQRFLEANPRLLLGRRPQLRWPTPGEAFLGFQLLHELGRGAFGRVFLATEPALGGRRVAVKVAEHGAAEADTLAKLAHPGVTPVHSVQLDEATGLTVVCMPYLGCATLRDLYDRAFPQEGLGTLPRQARTILEAAHPVDPALMPSGLRIRPDSILSRGTYLEGVLHIAAQLAEALAFVHSQGICHRDLKPSNVLLTPSGQALLLDFNLAGSAGDNRLGGTLPYMAPEQLRAATMERGSGDATPPDLDGRADLFALGVVLHELLTGQHPFGPLPNPGTLDEWRVHLLERHQTGARPIREHHPDIDARLGNLLDRCLAFDPIDRPQTAGDLAVGLRRALILPARCRRWLHRSRRLAAGLAALFVASSILVILQVRSLPTASERDYQLGLRAFRQGEYQESVRHLNRSLEEVPDQARVLFLRGRAQQRRGDFTLALADFIEASHLDNDGRSKAASGYCLNKLRRHDAALLTYREAVDKGYRVAAVYNNMGFSHLQNGVLQNGVLPQARAELDLAVSLDSTLQAAYYNRGLVTLAEAAAGGKDAPVAAGLADFRKALDCGPASARLCRDAANLCILAREEKEASEHLRHALELGLEWSALERDPLPRRYRDRPWFAALKDVAAGEPNLETVRLLDPIVDDVP